MIKISNLPPIVIQIMIAIGIIEILLTIVDIFYLKTSVNFIQTTVFLIPGLLAVGLILRLKVIYFINLIVLALQVSVGIALFVMFFSLGSDESSDSFVQLLYIFGLTAFWLVMFLALRRRNVKEWLNMDSNQSLKHGTPPVGGAP